MHSLLLVSSPIESSETAHAIVHSSVEVPISVLASTASDMLQSIKKTNEISSKCPPMTQAMFPPGMTNGTIDLKEYQGDGIARSFINLCSQPFLIKTWSPIKRVSVWSIVCG
jgi:hypothetical protein